jgi:hypothetical protein
MASCHGGLGRPRHETVERLNQELFRTSPLIQSQAALPERHCDSKLYSTIITPAQDLPRPEISGAAFRCPNFKASVRIRTQGTCPSLRSYQSGPLKDLAMFRFLSILALSALCTLPDRASADAMKPHETLASEISSRQRCACSTWRGPTRVIHYRRYRSFRTAYLIGYDPLPYRFGSASVWARPYRYYWY